MARLDGAVSGHDALRTEAGISYRQLDHWCRLGLLPDVEARGRGATRTFSERDRRRVMTLAALTRAGLALSKAAEVAPALERDGVADLGDGVTIAVSP